MSPVKQWFNLDVMGSWFRGKYSIECVVCLRIAWVNWPISIVQIASLMAKTKRSTERKLFGIMLISIRSHTLWHRNCAQKKNTKSSTVSANNTFFFRLLYAFAQRTKKKYECLLLKLFICNWNEPRNMIIFFHSFWCVSFIIYVHVQPMLWNTKQICS